ncbi:MAG: hypothetical protein HY320_11580 [Armatimonadetes bacterium]|nr:hypothetical protein [Armatimonadota bacterium]
MLVKINLLPAYFTERKKVRAAVVIVCLLLVAEIGGLLFWQISLQKQAAAVEQDRATKQAEKDRLDALQAKAQGFRNQIDAGAPLLNFINGIMNFNKERPALYEQTADYTYRNITALSMVATNTQFTMEVYATNFTDLATFFRYMHNHPGIANPSISAIPAYSTRRTAQGRGGRGGRGGLPNLPPSIGEGATLGPGFGAGPFGMGGMSGMDGMGGMGGGVGGMSGGGSGQDRFEMMRAEMEAAMTGGGPSPTEWMGGNASIGAAGVGMGTGFRPGGNQGGGGIPGLGPLPPGSGPRGFRVTLTAALRKPIVRPEYGSSVRQVGGGGAGAGYGMMMGGGMMGPMGGMMGVGDMGPMGAPGGMGGGMMGPMGAPGGMGVGDMGPMGAPGGMGGGMGPMGAPGGMGGGMGPMGAPPGGMGGGMMGPMGAPPGGMGGGMMGPMGAPPGGMSAPPGGMGPTGAP